ncbi:hypothetical protein ACJMK2_008224, partial [Sinanodonta woodiana]
IDIDDDEVEINFLEKSGKYGKTFKMQSRKDKLWIKKANLLTILEKEQSPAGKSKRLDKTYQIDKSEKYGKGRKGFQNDQIDTKKNVCL